MKQMTSEQAKAFSEGKTWERMTPEARAKFQLWQDKLCMPFEVFQESMQALLGRPVWTHEFAFRDELKAEVEGNKAAPTMEEIMDMIPEDKRIVLKLDDKEAR